MAAQLQALVGGGAARPGPRRSPGRVSNPGGKGVKRNIPKHCVYPDCTNPSKGPRYSFLCSDHLNTPKAERQKLLAAWKAGQAGGEAPKQLAARRGRPGRPRKTKAKAKTTKA
jgi:hypothetical protein